MGEVFHRNRSKESQSYWVKQQKKAPEPNPLKENIEADVCIVGAGISGLTTAYFLSQTGKKIVICDKEFLGSGESQRTSAHLTAVLDDRFTDIEELFGIDGSYLAAQSHTWALKEIGKIAEKEGIDCSYKTVTGYLFPPSDKEADILYQEYEAAKRAGLNVELLNKSVFKSFDSHMALAFYDQAQFFPLDYLNGLMRVLLERGVEFYTNTFITNFDTSGPIVLTSLEGHTITCESLVVATNTPINDKFVMHTKQAAYRTYMIGGEVPKGYVEEALFWDTSDPYHYIRTIAKEDHDILIIGGEDHKTGQNKTPLECYEKLKEWSLERFPEIRNIEYLWSGQIMNSVDYLGFIGRNPLDNKNVYIATGDTGSGLTQGTIAGKLISDLILGIKNPWETLYDPSRNVKNAQEFLKENANTVLQYGKWLVPDNEKPCRLTRICPHLYAELQWNEAENTWDCPAHGSRFDCDGKVINGPAKKNLS